MKTIFFFKEFTNFLDYGIEGLVEEGGKGGLQPLPSILLWV